jgi:hypothetical protein
MAGACGLGWRRGSFEIPPGACDHAGAKLIGVLAVALSNPEDNCHSFGSDLVT